MPDAHASSDANAARYQAALSQAITSLDDANPLRRYTPTAGTAGQEKLENLLAAGIPANAASAQAALGLLRSGRLSEEEKVAMAPILFAIYTRDDASGMNEELATALRELALGAGRRAAHDATLYFAKLEYRPETPSVLRHALNAGIFDADAYYRELAHLVPTAPPEAQEQFMRDISASRNALASSILAGFLNSDEAHNASAFLKASPEMAALLRETEPDFGANAALFGGMTGLRYNDWLRATVAVESARSGRNAQDLIIERLSDPALDPRKLLSFLSSPEAAPLVRDAMPGGRVQALVARARLPAIQFPTNGYMAELADTMVSHMRYPPVAAQPATFGPPSAPLQPPSAAPEAPHTMPRPR